MGKTKADIKEEIEKDFNNVGRDMIIKEINNRKIRLQIDTLYLSMLHKYYVDNFLNKEED